MDRSIIQIGDKNFELFLPESIILEEIKRVAYEIKQDFAHKDPLFVCVLNGAFMFASDLIKQLDFPCMLTFVRLKSYTGTQSEGVVKEMYGLSENIENRHVVILEDIIDTGYTMCYLTEKLQEGHPASLKIATLLFKPEALLSAVKPDYVAKEIPNDFIVGYGLDYDGHGRNLRNIYKIKE
ncbi:MAG: hypoxanthine phosphoribosyltransferase [Dysgonamonadaceae bacterium]|jgi:hypoxanthine phosphoribosyltransferase|nr:hypoxanthine phosphoribosyltransferase [Dysgonamonadaceae bacterium]